MESYINDIVADMRKYIKANPKATPDAAWHHAMDVIQSALYVEPREYWKDAEKFVRKALEDRELRLKARTIDAGIYRAAVLVNSWWELDTLLYQIVCLTKHDEIIDRVKESSITCRQLS